MCLVNGPSPGLQSDNQSLCLRRISVCDFQSSDKKPSSITSGTDLREAQFLETRPYVSISFPLMCDPLSGLCSATMSCLKRRVTEMPQTGPAYRHTCHITPSKNEESVLCQLFIYSCSVSCSNQCVLAVVPFGFAFLSFFTVGPTHSRRGRKKKHARMHACMRPLPSN